MKQVLALSFRPQSFNALIGANDLIKNIRGHFRSGRMPPAWLFTGPTGCGKTTVARILALSLQCEHQKEFGNPCKDCQAKRHEFDIMEVNASEVSGVDDVRKVAAVCFYTPRLPSAYRVFILDEAQRLSDAAQNLLLKPFEDCPTTSVWIICTTDPLKILKTLRGRCLYYSFPPLDSTGVSALVYAGMKFVGKDPEKMGCDDLVEALLENRIYSPRMILSAVEKRLAGAAPKIAAQVELESTIDTLKVCRLVTRGDWKGLHGELKAISLDDSRAILFSLMGYFKGVLLQPKPVPKNAELAALGIRRLSRLSYMNDSIQPALIGVLYELAQKFSGAAFKQERIEEDDDDNDDD